MPTLSREERRRLRAERRSAMGDRSINQREFEVGPTPKRWPHFTEMEATPEADPKNVLGSTVKANLSFIIVSGLVMTVMFVGSALIPWALGYLLDSGLERGLTSALIPGSLLLIGAVALRAIGAWSEPFGQIVWNRGSLGWQANMIRHVGGARGGGRQHMPAGEVVAAVTSDAQKVGNFVYMLPSTFGALVSFIVIVVLMLTTNFKLGLLVAIGLPLAIALMSLIIKPLQTRLDANRTERGKLTSLATDAVSGLRVLRGVGGEDSYNDRYRAQSNKVEETGIEAAKMQAMFDGLNSAVPSIFTAIVVGVGLLDVVGGTMSFGDLVAFYGYTSYLSVPVSQATQLFQGLSDAKVGANRIEKVMAVEHTTNDSQVDPDATVSDWHDVDIVDAATGVEIRSGTITALVSDDPSQSSALAERISRIDDEETIFVTDGDRQTDLRKFPLEQVRENIVLSDAIAQLFQGRLRSNLNAANTDEPLPRTIAEQMEDTGDGSGIANRIHVPSPTAATDDELMSAMSIADAEDVVQSLEGGLDGHIAERGRSLSGGQRQRVALARAVLTDSPVLILIEPTSAVDSHTEARIANRLRMTREGRTTVVVTSSPIMLGIADEVVLVDDAGELARGPHDELLADARYHRIVHRASGEEESE